VRSQWFEHIVLDLTTGYSAFVIGLVVYGFRIVIGVQAWAAELDRLGRTPEQNPT